MCTFICGAGTIHHKDDDEEQLKSPISTPKKSKKGSKNPYSTRGLDKFSALLSELEEKKEKIYSQNGSKDISFVRFVYKNSDDCIPIVVKQKDEKKFEKKSSETKSKSPPLGARTPESKISNKVENRVKQVKTETDKKKGKKRSFSWRRPSYYLPVVIVLILLLLVFFGRSAVTLFTCIAWYMVPTLLGDGSNVRKSTQNVRKLSDNRLAVASSSPKSVARNKSPEQRGHRRP